MRIIYVFAILLASAEEQYREPSEEEYLTMDVSSMMDEYLPHASQLLVNNNLDPMPIPDFKGGVYVGLPFLPAIRHKARLVLSSGSLKHVSEFQRNGSAVATYGDSVYTANAVVEFDNVLLTYNYSLKLMLLEHRGYINAEAYSIRANLTVDFNPWSYGVALRRLDLSNTESIHVWIRASNWMQWMITPVTNIFVGLFKNSLIRVVEEIATAMIGKHIRDFIAEMFP